MLSSPQFQKPEAKINSGEILIGIVWLVAYAVMIMSGYWRDAGPLLAAIDLSGLH
jgi:tryptophan-rich sensory protein